MTAPADPHPVSDELRGLVKKLVEESYYVGLFTKSCEFGCATEGDVEEMQRAKDTAERALLAKIGELEADKRRLDRLASCYIIDFDPCASDHEWGDLLVQLPPEPTLREAIDMELRHVTCPHNNPNCPYDPGYCHGACRSGEL